MGGGREDVYPIVGRGKGFCMPSILLLLLLRRAPSALEAGLREPQHLLGDGRRWFDGGHRDSGTVVEAWRLELTRRLP